MQQSLASRRKSPGTNCAVSLTWSPHASIILLGNCYVLCFMSDYFVSQHSQSFDIKLHDVSGFEPGMNLLSQFQQGSCAHGPGSEHFSRLELNGLGGPGYHLWKGPMHLVHVSDWQFFGVDFGGHLEIELAWRRLPVLQFVGSDEPWSERGGEVLCLSWA